MSGSRVSRDERRSQILDAALVIADEEGLEGLSMRKLCTRLGLSAPIVYRQFKDKAEIVEGLVRRLMSSEPLGSRDDHDARGWVRHVFTTMHGELTSHPGLITLFAATGPLLDEGLEVTESVLDALADMGSEHPGAAFQMLMAYTLGSVVMARGTDISGDDVARTMMRYPRVLKSIFEMDARDPKVFGRGIDRLLDGLLPAQ